MIYHGRNLIIYAGGTAIAGCRSCDISVEADLLETSSPMNQQTNDGGWAKYLSGRKRWSVNCSYLVTAFKSNLLKVGQTVTLRMAVYDTDGTAVSDEEVSGTAICQRNQVTATIGNLCQGSFVFQGSGKLG